MDIITTETGISIALGVSLAVAIAYIVTMKGKVDRNCVDICNVNTRIDKLEGNIGTNEQQIIRIEERLASMQKTLEELVSEIKQFRNNFKS